MFFGHEIIEVATFRAASAPSQGEETEDDPDILPEVGASEDNREAEEELDRQRERDAEDVTDRVLDDQGRILRDNSYGSIEEESGGAISPATACTTTSMISRCGITSAGWKTSRRGGCG